MQRMKTTALLILGALAASTISSFAEWTRFRGPNGSGVASADSKPPLKWSSSQNIAWKADLPGAGASSPIVVGDKVFVTCYSGADTGIQNLQRHVVCVSKADGKVLWDAKVPAVQPEDEFSGFLATEHGYASNSPASDGERVYVFFGKSGALAFDLNGKELWQTALGTNSNSRRWGSAASVMLTSEHVVVNAFDEGGALVGLNKTTGEIAWKAPAQGLELAYSTPVLVKHGDTEDLVLAVPQEIWGMNPSNGKLRWYATHELPGNVSPGVLVGDNEVYVFGGYPRTGSAAIKLGGKDDITKDIIWTTNNSSYVPTPVLHDGHLYVVNDKGMALCMEAKTGKVIYEERIMDSAGAGGGGGRRGGGKPFYASPVLADGKLYCVSRKNGTFVVAAKPQYELLSKNVIDLDDTQFNATPAVDGNRLYIRSDKAMYCVGE
jgi:outer membrane protein assembly factor BamB